MNRALLPFLLIPFLLNGQQTFRIYGKVAGEDGALPLVNVYLKGTSFGAVSDADGNYVIAGIPEGTYLLMASYTGYQTFRLPVSVSGSG